MTLFSIATITALCTTTFSSCMETEYPGATPQLQTTQQTFQQNDVLMQKLYNEAALLLSHHDFSTTKLNAFIRSMKTAQQAGITEDAMGQLSTTLNSWFAPSQPITLFFSCLKHYTTVTIEKSAARHNLLVQKLNTASKSNTQENNAWTVLCHDMDAIRNKKIADYIINNGINFMYFHKELLENNSDLSMQFTSPTWEEHMCKDAFKLYIFCNNNLLSTTHTARNAAHQALALFIKKIQLAKRQQFYPELGEFALKYEPDSYFNVSAAVYSCVVYSQIKERISLIFASIKKYNDTICDPHKQTPTHEQTACYTMTKKLHIALPAAFDTKLLDPAHVAFAEFKILLKDVKLLLQSDEQDVHECVKILYPDYEFQ